jgi:hypothetical protein
METIEKEEEIAPETFLLAFCGEAVFCLTDAEKFNPFDAGDYFAKAERYARQMNPERGDPFLFELDAVQEKIMDIIVGPTDFSLEEGRQFIQKAIEFCNRHK